jgi:hypothetical protein
MSNAANAMAQKNPSTDELLTPVLKELIRFAGSHRSVWSGTAGELLSALKPHLASAGVLWTEGVNAFYDCIDRNSDLLRNHGLTIEIRRCFPRILCIQACDRVELLKRLPEENSAAEIGMFSVGQNAHLVSSLQKAENLSTATDGPDTPSRPDNVLDMSALAGDCRNQSPLFDSVPSILLALTDLDHEIGQGKLRGNSAVEFAAARIAKLINAAGVAVIVLQRGSLLYKIQIGANVGLELFMQPANLGCLRRLGRPIHIADVRKNAQLSSLGCYIESLTVAPVQSENIEGSENIEAVIQFGFAQHRDMDPADVIVLKIITEIFAELMNSASS